MRKEIRCRGRKACEREYTVEERELTKRIFDAEKQAKSIFYETWNKDVRFSKKCFLFAFFCSILFIHPQDIVGEKVNHNYIL